MNNTISINYPEAEAIIQNLDKGLADMYHNVQTLKNKTNEVIGFDWIGADATAMKEKIDELLNKLHEQCMAINQVKINLRNYIEKVKQSELTNSN